MNKELFAIHACEQVLRFSTSSNWDRLSEEVKVQLGFNMGALALWLELSKEDGFLALTAVRTGAMSMQDFHKHIRRVSETHRIAIDETKVARPF